MPKGVRLELFLAEVSADYRAVPKPEPTLAALRARRPEGIALAFDHHQEMDLEGLLGRAWSSSYVVHGVEDAPAFDAALTAVFEAHQREGRVRLGYRTLGWAWGEAALDGG